MKRFILISFETLVFLTVWKLINPVLFLVFCVFWGIFSYELNRLLDFDSDKNNKQKLRDHKYLISEDEYRKESRKLIQEWRMKRFIKNRHKKFDDDLIETGFKRY